MRNRGFWGAPPIFWKKCEQISEIGDFEIFIKLLGAPQYSSCCTRPEFSQKVLLKILN